MHHIMLTGMMIKIIKRDEPLILLSLTILNKIRQSKKVYKIIYCVIISFKCAGSG